MKTNKRTTQTTVWICVMVCSCSSFAGEGIDFFEAKIRPLLAQHCYECHSGKGGVVESGLDMDTRSGLLGGGDRGVAVVVGKPEESPLMKALNYRLDDLEMPPDGKLSQRDRDLISHWIRTGATMPKGDATDAVDDLEAFIDMTAARTHWAFQPLKPVSTRVDRKSLMNPIDRWILHYQKKNRLQSTGVALPEQLIRRLSFNLTGLAPEWQDVAAFAANPSEVQYDNLVNKYLSSSAYGERWARHWLDLVRYTDTTASWLESTAGSFRYRDWVVLALNDDVPYDRFVKLQFAADLMNDSAPGDVAALGLVGLSPTYWKEPRLAPLVIKTVVAEEWEERIDMVGRTFLGLSLACARCHNHKMDPITQHDYYALAGVFASSRILDIPLVGPDKQAIVRAAIKEAAAIRVKIQRQKVLKEGAKDKEAHAKQILKLQAELKIVSETTAQFDAPRVMAVVEDSISVIADGPDLTKVVYTPNHAIDVAIQFRGNPATLGEVVPRRFIELMDPQKTPFSNGSGRLELAESLVSKSEGLFARVIVNRVWRHHFGKGIVATPSNFGLQGAVPSHPELLETLALGLIENKWSLKWLQRVIVTSRTFRQSCRVDEATIARDPSNRWYGRMNRRQHDIEAWRDSMLQVTGLLDFSIGGEPSLLSDPDNNRRTLYATVKRRELDEVLKMFGFPEPTAHSPKRDEMNTPLQQLYSLNSAFIWKCANHFASSYADQQNEDLKLVVAELYRKVYSREVTPYESSVALDYLEKTGSDGLRRYIHALLISNEFAFLD
ncbi:MAG: DUF1553 domain-containing protein [Planctomycetaceae bacterium]|nr:DUF1553 domain-containing protein [Planctomycetaceae bacterium]